MRAFNPGVAALFRHTLRRLRRDRPACWIVEQSEAIRVLERDRIITASEAHALRAGEHLSDLYAEVAADEVGVSAVQLDEVEHLIRIRNLPEALVQLGRMHPALRDLPDLYDRSADRGRA